MGTPKAAVPSLESLIKAGHEVVAVYTQPDRPAGRGNIITQPPVKESAILHGIHVYQPEKLRTDEAIIEFKSHDADVAIVVAYGRILSADYLNAFRLGAINVHFSLLPKYRGAAPVNWAIVNGETETGVTTMKMDIGLDTGDILLQHTTSIGDDETAIELMDRLSVVGADLLIKTLSEFDNLSPIRQDDDLATLAPIMKKSDGEVDWSMSAKQIIDRFRGFQPFPSSFSFFRGQRVRFGKASLSETSTVGEVGCIIDLGKDHISVACGGGSAVDLIELQPEGKKMISAANFINGSKPIVGEMFHKQQQG